MYTHKGSQQGTISNVLAPKVTTTSTSTTELRAQKREIPRIIHCAFFLLPFPFSRCLMSVLKPVSR